MTRGEAWAILLAYGGRVRRWFDPYGVALHARAAAQDAELVESAILRLFGAGV